MKDILEEILAYKRKEVEREKAELPPRTALRPRRRQMEKRP